MKNIKFFFTKIHNKIKKLTSLFFYLFPIDKNKIIFYNFKGNGFGDNPKYLANELLKRKKYKIVWFVKDLKTEMPNGIKKVKYGSLSALFHMITARLWIDTVRNNPKPIFKRKHQYYLQTWHGGMPIKGMEKDVEAYLEPRYVKDAKRDAKITDFMLSNCKKRTELIKNSFWYDGKVLEYGVPRDDVLIKPDLNEIKNFKKKYGINNKKIVLYAPSFRNDKNFYNTINFDPDKIIQTLNKKFKKSFVFCFKLHPNDANIDVKKYFKNGINLTNEPDSQLVLSACDVVISDYSSMLIDFILTKRLAITFAPDYDEYIKKERKMYIDIKNCGIPFAKTTNKLIKCIENFDKPSYIKKIKKLRDFFGVFEKGNSSEKIVKYLIESGVLYE